MDPLLTKINRRPINGNYILLRKVGKGGFGVVYLGRDLYTSEEVALKLEHQSVEPSILEEEATRYGKFRGAVGIPHLYWFGWHDDFKVMAFELLGPSLEDLFVFCGHQFSLKTTLLIVDQILDRLKALHAAGIVHRDIKPRNFLVGSGANRTVVYVTDFGLADEYTPLDIDVQDGAPILPRLVGTARFASIRGHKGRKQSPKDDLESLGYMIVYLMRGKLPWQGMKVQDKEEKERAVMEKKTKMEVKELCKGLPEEFIQYMREVQSLRAQDMPDYQKLRKLFQGLAEREGLSYDNIFDWTVLLFLESKEGSEEQN